MQASSRDQIPWLDASSYQPASGRALQENGGPDYGHSQFFMGANSQGHDTQLDASSYQSPIDTVPEVCSL